MKIVLVAHQTAGGIGYHVQSLQRNLQAHGHLVWVVCDAASADRFDFQPVYAPPTLPLIPTEELAQILSHADVVHAHGHRAGILSRAWLSSARLHSSKPSFFVTWHNAFPSSPLTRAGSSEKSDSRLGRLHNCMKNARVYVKNARHTHAKKIIQAASADILARWVARRAQLVSAVAQDVCDHAIKLGIDCHLEDVPSSRVATLLEHDVLTIEEKIHLRSSLYPHLTPAFSADAVKDEKALTRDLPANPQLPLIVTVARWAPQKDFPTLARIAHELDFPATWVIIGDGDEACGRELFDATRTTQNVNVVLAGRLNDVNPWLQAADAFVLTSLWEGKPLVVQEAMAAGLPVVATEAGQTGELLSPLYGVTKNVENPDNKKFELKEKAVGFKENVGDVAAFVRDIHTALTPVGREYGLNARRKMTAFPTPIHAAREWERRYKTGVWNASDCEQ